MENLDKNTDNDRKKQDIENMKLQVIKDYEDGFFSMKVKDHKIENLDNSLLIDGQ